MSPLVFFWLTLKASLLSTGGFGNVPSLHADLVRRGFAQNRQFGEALAVGQISPGPNGLWVVALGYSVQGPPGAVAATIAITIPPLLVIPVASLYRRTRHHPAVEGFVWGLGLGVIGIFVTVLYSLLRTGPIVESALIGIGSFAIGVHGRVPVAAVVLGAAVVGVLWR